jgi:exopolysaccharide production protein ExoQ
MLLSSMLFAQSLASVGAVLFVLLALAYIAVRFSQLGEIIAPRTFILAIPVFAVLSTLWSQSPVDTFKYSIEFFLTVLLGLLVSAAPRPKAVLWGMFLAFAIYIILNIGFGQNVDVGTAGSVAFSGLTESKNLLGDVAATGLLISAVCFVAAIEDRKRLRLLVALLAIAMHGYVLIEAKSAGSLIGVAVGLASFILLLALRPMRLSARMMSLFSALLVAGFIVLAYGQSMIDYAMAAFDKDPTFTGRTYIWERAADFIAENPVLGTGFNAFWLQGNPDAEGLWAYAGIQSRAGFSFHNTAIEILVNLGWAGLIIFGIVAVIATCLVVYRAMMRPTLAHCFWFSIIAYDAARVSIESIGTGPFSHPTVLIFAAFGSGLAIRRAIPAAGQISSRVSRRAAFFGRPPLRPTRERL